MLRAIDEHLETPYGVAMFAPAYTRMREDVGRLTQKWPGSAENGAVYNHAAAFYAAALYHVEEGDRAYRVLRAMLTQPEVDDIAVRGQLPLYIPNYYRGAWHQHPRTAGRSRNLFNTGTAFWFYRLVIEQLCGLRGTGDGVVIAPQIPSDWDHCRFRRTFRGAIFEVDVERVGGLTDREIDVDQEPLEGDVLRHIESGKTYKVRVRLPERA